MPGNVFLLKNNVTRFMILRATLGSFFWVIYSIFHLFSVYPPFILHYATED